MSGRMSISGDEMHEPMSEETQGSGFRFTAELPKDTAGSHLQQTSAL